MSRSSNSNNNIYENNENLTRPEILFSNAERNWVRITNTARRVRRVRRLAGVLLDYTKIWKGLRWGKASWTPTTSFFGFAQQAAQGAAAQGAQQFQENPEARKSVWRLVVQSIWKIICFILNLIALFARVVSNVGGFFYSVNLVIRWVNFGASAITYLGGAKLACDYLGIGWTDVKSTAYQLILTYDNTTAD
jgi:hypothetical protein